MYVKLSTYSLAKTAMLHLRFFDFRFDVPEIGTVFASGAESGLSTAWFIQTRQINLHYRVNSDFNHISVGLKTLFKSLATLIQIE